MLSRNVAAKNWSTKWYKTYSFQMKPRSTNFVSGLRYFHATFVNIQPMKYLAFLFSVLVVIGCSSPEANQEPSSNAAFSLSPSVDAARLDIYKTVRLTTDVSKLSEEDKALIPVLIEAAKIMNEIFWEEAYGDKNELLSKIEDPKVRTFAEVNYGPWDRLGDNAPFLEGVGPKSAGANFYPSDMTKEEFEGWRSSIKTSQYTMVRRDSTGKLQAIYYHKFFKDKVTRASELLKEASTMTTNKSLKYYLELRAAALLKDSYNPSDIAWLALEGNTIDVVLGPIETYEDQLFGYKAAHEAYILVKDLAWSKRLERYKEMLPGLQRTLPCDKKYRQDPIGGNAQLNAYDVIYYAGDCNSGGKTIAVNLPNDEEIQQKYGTRRSQLKNAMRSKFDAIMVPITDMLIVEEQQKNVTFDAFFNNTMFHEVAHGLGVKNTINGQGTVRESLKEQASALEEGKADILGLWMVTELHKQGEFGEADLMDNYVTFLAGIFRSVRFGASSAHGRANMLRFNYFQEKGAFTRNGDGRYSVNFEKMQEAMTSLSALILKLQGEGAYDDVVALMAEKGVVTKQLQADLDRLGAAGIPVDVVFEQGVDVLGL